MSYYLLIKYLHILSSTILFGTGIGTACNMFFAHRTRDPYLIAMTSKYVVMADWVFTGTSGFLQPVTGLALAYVAGYSLTSVWLLGSIIGYLIAAVCWFPVVYLQIKMRDLALVAYQSQRELPAAYFRYYRYWFILGWPAFLSLLGVFYLMVTKWS